MNVIKTTQKVLPVLCLSALLAACSSGGKSNPSQPQNSKAPNANSQLSNKISNATPQSQQPQTQTPNNQTNKNSSNNTAQRENSPIDIMPETPAPNTPPTANTPSAPSTPPTVNAPPAVSTPPTASTPSAPSTPPTASTPSAPNTPPTASTPSAPNTPPTASTPSAPSTPPTASTPSAPNTPPPNWSGAFSNHTRSNADLGSLLRKGSNPALTVYEFNQVHNQYSPDNGQLIIAEKKSKTIPLSAINVTGVGDGDYKIYLLNDNSDVYYGYYSDTDSRYFTSTNDKYHNYFSVYDENRVNTKVPTNLNATYVKEGGFVYGPTGRGDLDKRQTLLGTVNLIFTNGVASGEVINRNSNNEHVFKFSGNTKSLTVAPTPVNSLVSSTIHGVGVSDPAEMELKFIDSKAGANDYKYVTGTAKGDYWTGVLVGEKQP